MSNQSQLQGEACALGFAHALRRIPENPPIDASLCKAYLLGYWQGQNTLREDNNRDFQD